MNEEMLESKRGWRTHRKRPNWEWCSCSACQMEKIKAIEQRYLEMRKRRIIELFFFWVLVILMVIGVAIVAHASPMSSPEINLAIIADIESGGNPLAYNARSGAVGKYQIMPIVIKEWNARYIKELYYLPKDMYNAVKSREVADWYLNARIPQLLRAYRLSDTLINRLACYNWGIGHVRHWVRRGSRWNELPKETRNYIKRYLRKERNNGTI